MIVIVPMLLVVVSLTWGLIRLAPGNFYSGEKKLPPAIEKNIRENPGSTDRGTPVRTDAGQHRARRLRRVVEVSRHVGQQHPRQHAPRVGDARRPGVSSRADRRRHRGHAGGAATELANLRRLRVDGCRDGRHLDAELRSRPDTRAALRADVVLVSARTVGWIQQPSRAARADPLGRLHGVHRRG
ncbi:MAG: hypothetical protein QM736_09315 [Vicinamibacterales bacterium]